MENYLKMLVVENISKGCSLLQYYLIFFDIGQIIATECNFPEELISNGKYPDWSNSETLHNLRQLSRMDIEDYQIPNTRTSTPLNSGQKGKGIGKRRKILT